MHPAGETYLSESPYPGLRAFQRDEADIFFGREEQTDQLLERLQRGRFLAVVGPSGCGKSSLVRAGMMASLETGFLAGAGARWRIAEMRPGEQPLARLADALLKPSALGPERVGEPDAAAFLLAALRRGPLGLVEAWRETPPADRANLLLLVDQFEEIFRFRNQGNADEADAFVALLLAAAAQREAPIYVVMTMRSDFFGECALFGGLPEAINEGQYLTPRLTREQRQAAIAGPARVFGGNVAPELVNRLLNDMEPSPDQLPLLQHALMRMWRLASERARRSGGPPSPPLITPEDYVAVGTLDQALSLHADEVFASLTNKQQHIAEVMFRRLTERAIGKRDTRRPAPLKEVADVAGVTIEEVKEVVEACRQPGRSFITPPPPMPLLPETVLDIGHESLIRQWRQLNEWVQEEAQSAESYQRLKQTAHLWQEGNSEPLASINLERMLAWEKRQNPTPAWAARYGKPEDFDLAMKFLRLSEQEWQKKLEQDKANAQAHAEAEKQRILAQAERRRSKQLKISVVVVSLLLAVASAFAFYAFRKRGEAEKQTCIASSRGLATQADIQSRDGRLDLAMLLGAKAFDAYDTFEARSTLISLLAPNRGLMAFLHSTEQSVSNHVEQGINSVAFSPDGKLIAAARKDGKIVLWDVASRQPLGPQLEGHTSEVMSIAFSPDGKWLASGGYDKTVRLWDAEKHTCWHKLTKHNFVILSVAFSPDGKLLAFSGEDNTVQLWNLSVPEPLEPLNGHTDSVTSVAFNRDGKLLVSGSKDKTLRFWHVKTRLPLGPPIIEKSAVENVAFSHNGKLLAVSSDKDNGEKRFVHLRDVATRLPYGEPFRGPTEIVKSLAFSLDDKLLAAGSNDKTVWLWNVEAHRDQEDGIRLEAHRGYVNSVAFAPDGKTLATGSKDGLVALWDVANESALERPSLNYSHSISSLAFSVDGKLLATTSNDSNDNSILLWDMDSRRRLDRLLVEQTAAAENAAVISRNELSIGDGHAATDLWSSSRNLQPANFSVAGENSHARTVAFSPDGKTLACGITDKTIGFWDVESRQLKGRFPTNQQNVVSLAFSHDGKLLFSASQEPWIKLWDTTRMKPVDQWKWGDLNISVIAISPDGNLLASVVDDNNILFWDVSSRRPVGRPIQKHRGSIRSLAFSADGKLLATGSWDKTIWIWDVATRQPLGQPIAWHGGAVQAVAFNPNGLLASGYGDGICFWDLNFTLWKAQAMRIANRKLRVAEENQFINGLGQCAK